MFHKKLVQLMESLLWRISIDNISEIYWMYSCENDDFKYFWFMKALKKIVLSFDIMSKLK